jgi:uridine kinase
MGKANSSVLLAISGPSCSGKTTLAEQVAEYARVGGRSVDVIHFDDFLRPKSEHPRRSPEHVGYYEDAFDYAGLAQEAQRRSSRIDHPDLLIVEGEFLLRREYREAWDVKVWIEIEESLALARGIERDAKFFGSRKEAERIYLNRCLPANRLHRQADAPDLCADLVLTSTANGLVVQSLR